MDQDDALVKIYRSKYSSLSQLRSAKISLWTDIRNFLAPNTARLPGELPNQSGRQDLNIINSSPRDAVRVLAAGLQSGVTNPMRPWFKLGTPDPDLQDFQPVKEWLAVVEQIMRDMMLRSNIYDRLKANYGTLGTYGTSAMALEADAKSVFRAYDFPIGSFMLATDETYRVTTCYRDVMMTCEQMIRKFGKGNDSIAVYQDAKKKLPYSVIAAYDQGDYDTTYPMCQIIEPNRKYRPGNELSQFKQFASVWFDPARSGNKGAIYSLSGYDDCPVQAPRWDVLGEDVYGYGCGEFCIGDGKQMQLMEKRKLQGIDKNVHPPMIADSSMRNQRTTIMPGETTYVNGLITGRPGFQAAYQVNPYIKELREEIANVERRVDVAFYKNLFLMVSEIGDQPDITATQINALREEKLLMLGPVLERLNDEQLDPTIDRVFNFGFRAGMFPPAPKELEGMPLRVEYISVLGQAQKALGIGNMERLVGFVERVALMQVNAQQPPTALDKLNTDEMIDEYADGISVSPTIVNSQDQAAEIRDGRAKQAAMQQATQMASAGADIAAKLGKADMSGDNALTRAVQIAGGPQ